MNLTGQMALLEILAVLRVSVRMASELCKMSIEHLLSICNLPQNPISHSTILKHVLLAVLLAF